MSKTRLNGWVLILSLLFISPASWAAGDAAAGKSKSVACMGCHAIEGYNNAYPNYHVPRLGGQHAAYIVAALKAYKAGQRQHKTMIAQASGLTDQDMLDIAEFFSHMTK